MTTTTDLTPFKQHILHFLQLKNVEPPTIERVNQLMSTMDDQHLFLFCEFSFILKRRECDPIKKTGEHAIRDYLQTFWHDENRLVKDLRYADYIHYFTKYSRCSELFDFFKLCTEHGNRKRPLSYTVKLQEFMATPIETLRSRSERKSKSSPKSTSTRRISGTKRMKQEESIPCDLQYIPSTKKIRTETQITIKSETTIKSEPFYDHSYNLYNAPVDVFATDFNQQYDEQWSPQSQDSDLFSHPSQSPSPRHSPSSSINSSPQYSYPELETYPQYASSAAPPTWTRVPSLSNPELCASEADWDAIAQDLNKTYQPIVEAYYQPVYPMMYHHHYTTSQGWFAPSTTHSS